METYIYKGIYKKVNNDIFSIGYSTIEENIKSNPIFITRYCVYLNNNRVGCLQKTNLSKEELINTLNDFIECYYKRIKNGNNN